MRGRFGVPPVDGHRRGVDLATARKQDALVRPIAERRKPSGVAFNLSRNGASRPVSLLGAAADATDGDFPTGA